LALSLIEQKQLDILIKGIRLKYDALERGDLDMSPSVKNHILDLYEVVILLYEKMENL
jgi:hypothetical protein